jgi:hypothetical protein
VLNDDGRLMSWWRWCRCSGVFDNNWCFVSWRRCGMLSYDSLVRRCNLFCWFVFRDLHDNCLVRWCFMGWCFMLRLLNDDNGMSLRSLNRMSGRLSSDVLCDCLDDSDMNWLLDLDSVNNLNGLLNLNSMDLLNGLLNDLSMHHCDGYLNVDRLLDFNH